MDHRVPTNQKEITMSGMLENKASALILMLGILLVMVVAASCGGSGISPFETDHEPGSDEYFDDLERYYKQNKGATEEIELFIEPYTKECFGPFRMDCLIERLEDGTTEFFYDGIRGFEFESGYGYKLRILKTQTYDLDDVPQDIGVYTYELLEIVEKTKQGVSPS